MKRTKKAAKAKRSPKTAPVEQAPDSGVQEKGRWRDPTTRDGHCHRPGRIVQPDPPEPMNHYLPNYEAEQLALRETIGEERPARRYQIPLGDLIVRALTFRDPFPNGDPKNWTTFEQEALQAVAVEARAYALAFQQEVMHEPPWLDFTGDDMVNASAMLARRLEALAELSVRLRDARYGHPSFGGEDPEEIAILEPSSDESEVSQ